VKSVDKISQTPPAEAIKTVGTMRLIEHFKSIKTPGCRISLELDSTTVRECATVKFVARIFICLLMLGFVLAAPAQRRGTRILRTPPAPAAPASNYVRIWDWARSYQFNLRWLSPGKILELTRRNGDRLVFTGQSREALVNGVKIILSFPAIVNGGAGWISSLDLRASIQPILVPQKNVRGDKIKTIVLDPGHGGKDDGARNGSYFEKTYTLLLAQEVRNQLTAAGFTVSLTRTTDTYIDLPPRPDFANRLHADLFVSLHFNTVSSGASDVSGSQVYCFTPVGASSTNARGEGTETAPSAGNRNDSKNVLLAYDLQKSLTKALGAEDRGVCRGRLKVLREAEMPAVLIESAYISNPEEVKKIIDPAYRKQAAQAIVNGIMAYKSQVE